MDKVEPGQIRVLARSRGQLEPKVIRPACRSFSFLVLAFHVVLSSPSRSLYNTSCMMPHTLLVSFSLLALVVTARPIAPVSYVFYGDQCRSRLTRVCAAPTVITCNPPRFRTPSKLSSRTAPSLSKYIHTRSPPHKMFQAI